jgi:competence protein ComEA
MSSRIRTWLASRTWLVPGWRVALLVLLPPLLGLAALAAVFVFVQAAPPSPAALAQAEANPGAAAVPATVGLLVEVSGAVAHPGLYRVQKGDRVSAAIAAAGGFSPDADPTRLPNMAARLRDGQQVKVPVRGSTARSTAGSSTTGLPRVAPVSLNAATEEELAAVPGFTPDLAAAVVLYRSEYGGFTTTRELVDVLQMSEADYLVAKGYLRV